MAAVDYFLKIDGIDGESGDSKHSNQIDVLSWNFGASNTGTMSYGSGGGSGKVNMQDFHFTMKFNKASPLFLLRCADGSHIKSGILYCRKSTGEGGQQEYLTYTFSDLLISHYQTGGAGGHDPIPTESIAFNFAKIELEYKPQLISGGLGAAVKHGWDVKKNEKV